MARLKFFEIVLLAVSALVTAAKSVVKFIDYMSKIKNRPEPGTA